MGIVRKTKSLEFLIGVFTARNDAISAVELVKKSESQMNKTTVYRILDRMEEEGMIHSFKDSNGLLWYAKCNNCSSHKHSDLHPHLHCKKCGGIKCLNIDITIPTTHNVKIDTAEIMLTGTCEECLNNQTT